MKSYNLEYTDPAELTAFVKRHDIARHREILLQIFTGVCDADFIENLIEQIVALVPHVHIIGTTTNGEILDDRALNGRTVLSFTIFEKTRVRTYGVARKEPNQPTAELARELIAQFPEGAKAAISFADGLHTNGEVFVDAFHAFDPNLVVAGGLAGDNEAFRETLVFTQKGLVENGAVAALLFGDDLQVGTLASFGWEPIGKTMTVTKAKENVVYEIDHKNVIDVYAKYLGEDIAKRLPLIGIEFPLIVQRGEIAIPRACVAKNPDGSLAFGGNLYEGDRVTFGYGNVDAILSYSSTLKFCRQPEAIFVYSCVARKKLMGESVALELHPLAKIAPVSGFFTYGEFYTPLNGPDHLLLNETMTILSLRETVSDEMAPQKVQKIATQDRRRSNLTLKAFSHLIAQTTSELEEINRTLERRVREEVEKNRQKDQMMLHQTKLAQMGEMISMIAHQWRQPLGAISATTNDLYLKVLMDSYDKVYFENKLQQIEKMSQHLSATIDDFRGFYKQDKERVHTHLHAIVQSVLDMVSVSLKNKNIDLRIALHDRSVIDTYPNEVRQVVLNLVKNAEDVLIENEVTKGYIKIDTFEEEGFVYLVVSDNGGGVPERLKEQIFEPYFSTKLQKEGTGLGLYMSKLIVEEHCGGKIWVENSDEGARFKLRLPLAKEAR